MRLHLDKEIINSLSVKHRVKAEIIESIINHGLKSIKECMSMDDMPNILLHNLGRYKPSKYLLDKKFTMVMRFIEKDPNNALKIDWDIIRYQIKAYDRILIEENVEESESASKIREIINSKYE